MSNPNREVAITVNDAQGHVHGPNCNHGPSHGGHGHGGHSHGGRGQGGHSHGGHSHGGHSHDHDGDDECGHDHGGHGHSHGGKHGHKHGGKNKWFMSHGLEIKLFVYAVCLSVWAAVVFWFCEPLEGGFERTGGRLIMTFIVAMAIICHVVCAATPSSNPTKNPPVYAGPGTQPCKTCSFWKPDRTHHCSACGKCVLRMDHHCPWVVNCVGYRNHKSFFLFCFYVSLGGLFYTYRLIYYFVVTISNDDFFELGVVFLIGLVVLSVIAIPGTLMVTGLAFYHFSLAMNNLTTLESMGGSNMKTPCDNKVKKEAKEGLNKFDKGMLANLYDFFGHTYLFWWYPTVPEAFYTGQSFEQMTTPTPLEIMDFLRGRSNEESMEERIMKPRSLAEVDLDNIFRIGERFTSDKHLQFFDKMLEIGKRRDNTYKEPVQQVKVVEQTEHKEEVAEQKEEEEVAAPAEATEEVNNKKEEQEREGAVIVSENALSDQAKEEEAVNIEGEAI